MIRSESTCIFNHDSIPVLSVVFPHFKFFSSHSNHSIQFNSFLSVSFFFHLSIRVHYTCISERITFIIIIHFIKMLGSDSKKIRSNKYREKKRKRDLETDYIHSMSQWIKSLPVNQMERDGRIEFITKADHVKHVQYKKLQKYALS